MKKIAFILITALLFSCNSTKEVAQTKAPEKEGPTSVGSGSMVATKDAKQQELMEKEQKKKGSAMSISNPNQAKPDINNLVPDDEDLVILLGEVNRQGFKKDPFNKWFDLNLKGAGLDDETMASIEPLLKGINIKAFMGTWCEDSQREIPNFYKILDATNFDYEKLTVYAVSRDKDTPSRAEKGLNIQQVPTIIFYRDGEELGRYVEFARESLDKDMLAILSGADYKHSYED